MSRGAGAPPAVEIRPLRGHDEYRACLALQRDTWGDAPGTLVPTPLLIVAQRLGGVAAGAFDADGRLLGFVFGLTGVERGQIVHWSDMLAVRPELRDHGLGRRLKEYQREQVARVGARVIYWTYDPLVAKNAWLNLVVLGARVSEYVPDMYGDTGSPMHAGLGTDRIVVAWDVAPSRASDRARELESQGKDPGATVLNAGGAAFTLPPDVPDVVAIEIPADIFAVRERSPVEARAWRQSSREAFRWALDHGYVVSGVDRGPGTSVARYVLQRASERRAS